MILFHFQPWQAEGLTAMEAWVIACIVFVFAALMEYTGILLQVTRPNLAQNKFYMVPKIWTFLCHDFAH